MKTYMLDDIIKLIRDKKIEKGDKFRAIETPVVFTIEYDGSDLIYNDKMCGVGNIVNLCSGEMNTKFVKCDNITIYCPICARKHSFVLDQNEVNYIDLSCDCNNVLKLKYDSVAARLEINIGVYINEFK